MRGNGTHALLLVFGHRSRRRRRWHDELARGAECFRAAEALLALGLVADAVSRTYYGVVHVLRALFFSLVLDLSDVAAQPIVAAVLSALEGPQTAS